jgi:8-oxo-dGTP pyrophosphatase MutT (NUDIX family)
MDDGSGSGPRCGSERCASVNMCGPNTELRVPGPEYSSARAGRHDKRDHTTNGIGHAVAKGLINRKIMHGFNRLTRSVVLGVRVVVTGGSGEVLLVRHTYIDGWYLPGGGVDKGESSAQAVVRELREEAGIEVIGTPSLFALYLNARVSGRDHVALYVVRDWRDRTNFKRRRLEISEIGLFPPDRLPDGTSGATRRRLSEVLTQKPPAQDW